MIRRPPRSTLSSSSAASDVYKRQGKIIPTGTTRCVAGGASYRRCCSGGGGGLCWGNFVYSEGDLIRKCRGVEDLSLIHISEPTRLLSISYAVFCLKKKTNNIQ
eukprot:TRINITY_DN47770_c0_g1_i1.p1 TRINITY_DN47770_c0_g1~~TRINITY_DN47770_c0_g1_i1.p1  ORF type:complete len:104 (+),score=24.59 TRINITY_DN47770_c0_g1_i1:33-344(+)